MHTRFVHAHRVVRPNLSLQALETLTDSADSLGPFLDTTLSNDRETFDSIQRVVTDVFPEFKLVNPEKAQNTVSITLTRRDMNEKVPLTHCGTGVEQVLALATFVLTSAPGTIILLDEPHSYLHPTAERQVVDFLFSHREHRYVISTHSAILINSVPADRILVLGESNTISAPSSETPSVPALLHSLGYKNSDLLFNDRLIFVEGESDQDILPLLLLCNPLLSRPDLEKTGFPVMDGEGRLRGRDQQTSLMYWEKFLVQLGKQSSPRVYLFDGACLLEDQKLLEKTKVFDAGSAALLRFLTMHEIENYLLVP
jgi:energy-coupling factor transporter ATP-binding protein EcfA2